MIVNKVVKYGFYYNGSPYGWINKELYKLPYFNGKTKRSNELRKIKKVGNHYLIERNKVTLETLKNKTEIINFELQTMVQDEVPF